MENIKRNSNETDRHNWLFYVTWLRFNVTTDVEAGKRRGMEKQGEVQDVGGGALCMCMSWTSLQTCRKDACTFLLIIKLYSPSVQLWAIIHTSTYAQETLRPRERENEPSQQNFQRWQDVTEKIMFVTCGLRMKENLLKDLGSESMPS